MPVLNAPSGLRYPMSVSALPGHAVIALMGPGVSSGLDSGRLVMGETSAGLHGIVAGDVVELIAFNGSVVSLAVSSVVPDSACGLCYVGVCLIGACDHRVLAV